MPSSILWCLESELALSSLTRVFSRANYCANSTQEVYYSTKRQQFLIDQGVSAMQPGCRTALMSDSCSTLSKSSLISMVWSTRPTLYTDQKTSRLLCSNRSCSPTRPMQSLVPMCKLLSEIYRALSQAKTLVGQEVVGRKVLLHPSASLAALEHLVALRL